LSVNTIADPGLVQDISYLRAVKVFIQIESRITLLGP
jgi:hypothetical protein